MRLSGRSTPGDQQAHARDQPARCRQCDPHGPWKARCHLDEVTVRTAKEPLQSVDTIAKRRGGERPGHADNHGPHEHGVGFGEAEPALCPGA